MADCENGSEMLPSSEDYYAVVDNDKLIFLYVDVVLTVIIFVLFGEECYFVLKTYKHREISVKTIWLVSIYPVFALSSLLAVIIPRATNICDFVSTCYLSGCLFQFSSLLLLYFGTVEHLLYKVKDRGFRLRVCPCCCMVCCPVLPPIRKSLVTIRLMIFQTAILQPMIQFIAAVLWADGKYHKYGIDFTEAYAYLQILKLTSTITAIYGLNALHRSTMSHLKTHSTRPKQLVLQLVMFFFNVQGSLMDIPTRYNKPAERKGLSSHFQMNQWHHLVLVVEMFLLSFLARLLYRRPLELDALLESRPGNLEDIYTPDTASENHADGIPTKALPTTNCVTDQIQSVTTEKNAKVVEPDEVCMTTENNVGGDAAGNINPAFNDETVEDNKVDAFGNVNPTSDIETADNDKVEQQKTFTADVGNEEKHGTTPTNKEEIPSGDNLQSIDHSVPRERNVSVDNEVPCHRDNQQSTNHTETCDNDVLANPDDQQQVSKATKMTASYENCLTPIEDLPEANTHL